MKKCLMAVATILTVMLAINNNLNREPKKWEDYIVRSGDTVYDVAISITPVGGDYRDIQHCILEKNDIINGMIYPGQVILIPVCE